MSIGGWLGPAVGGGGGGVILHIELADDGLNRLGAGQRKEKQAKNKKPTVPVVEMSGSLTRHTDVDSSYCPSMQEEFAKEGEMSRV